MVLESQLEKTEHGLVSTGEGSFVLNMRDAVWRQEKSSAVRCVAGLLPNQVHSLFSA
jgi:hypothetical protein